MCVVFCCVVVVELREREKEKYKTLQKTHNSTFATQAGFDYSASTDPRSDFQRIAYPAKPYTPIKRANRIFGATFVARNCNRKRAAMVTKIASLIPVYSLSSCVPAGTIRRPMGNAKKITAISYYTHHLAFENSICDGYVTEKIWDALKAGCIPIYWGAKDVKRYIGFEPIRADEFSLTNSNPHPPKGFTYPRFTYKCDVCRLGARNLRNLRNPRTPRNLLWCGLSTVRSASIAIAHMNRIKSLMNALQMSWRLAVLVPHTTPSSVISAYQPYGDVYMDEPVHGTRTQRLAKLRNQLFKKVNSAWKYVIVNDFDAGVRTKPFKVSSFRRAFELIGVWNGISFLMSPYWDLWALRESNVMPYSHWGPYRYKNHIRTFKDANNWLDGKSEEVVPVTSAFMMLVVYKPSVLMQRYDELSSDCEHVSMHRNFTKIGILRKFLR